MAIGKSVPLFLLVLASASIEAHSRGAHQASGRKLFGGYRIVPKVCQPTIPSRVKSDQPAICMFNYECSRRNGEVVGACMDGFLFGACCQLPPKDAASHEKITATIDDDLYHLEPIDHVPEIPILLNPDDGTPIGITVPQTGSTVKTDDQQGTVYTKISTLTPSSTSKKPGFAPSQDSVQNAERPQIQMQPDVSHLMEDIPLLLGQQNFIDELSLPGLLTHSDSNNDIQDHQDNSVNPVTTLLSPDQVLQIADPVDQLPQLFSHGLGQSNHTSAETILLNENGTALDESNNPDDLFKPGTDVPYTTIKEKASEQAVSTTEKVRVTESAMTTEQRKKITQGSPGTSTTQWVRFPDQSTLSTMPTEEKTQTPAMSKLPMVTQMYANTQRLTTTPPETEYTVEDKYEKVSTIEERVSTKELEAASSINQEATTPMTASSEKDELVRVPTITYGTPSGNKKNDIVDKEELAINHIISILNGTTPSSDNSGTVHQPSSPIHTWVSIDETAKPNSQKTSTTRLPGPTSTGSHTFPYTFYRPSSYYNYETVPTSTSYSSLSTVDSYSSRPSTQTSYGGTNSYGYSVRPTTNPPAPTVIVLGPLGTEYTTETTPKSVATRRPVSETSRPALITARPTPSSTRPVPLSTKKPSVSTTITHNISTVISNVATDNNRVVSTSVITVNLKDGTSAKPTVSTDVSTEPIVDDNSLEDRITTKRPALWTTLSSWSEKPSFHLKPSTPPVVLAEENLTPVNTVVFKDTTETTSGAKATTPAPCDEETAAPDDLINFPPVRNPNLNISGSAVSQQEKPLIPDMFNHTRYPDLEIISENDIPTPTFIEDDVLTNKVDTFVNKIVESLQSNFQGLKDVVYSRNNATTTTVAPTVTKRPAVVSSTTRRPLRRPTSTAKPLTLTTRRPTTTRRPIRPSSPRPIPTDRPRPKPTTPRPRPTTAHSVTTKKPSITTRRTKPTRRPTTTTAPSTEAIVVEEETTSVTLSTEKSTIIETHSAAPGDFRKQCGIRPLVRTGKIVGGKSAEFGEWPWQVLVREATWLGLFTKNKCGGVLITDKFVLTAAHCQPGFLAALVAVFGEFDLSGEREEKRSITRNVRNVIVNRAYNPTTFENDLALLELETPVQFDDHIVPICMPDDGIDFTGRMATVTGWGRLKYNGGVPSTLQEVEVPIMENSVCQEMFLTAGYSKLILDSFLCAGYATGQKDSCEGDSGGPLVMQRPDGRWFLVGTVSHGIKCASPYLPGVYMRTAHFKPWLNKVTGVV